MTAANNVVIYPWWVLPEQALNRVHRLGQTKEVHGVYLIAAGTIDEDILTLHQEKQSLFEQVVEGRLPGREWEEGFAAALAGRLGVGAAPGVGASPVESTEEIRPPQFNGFFWGDFGLVVGVVLSLLVGLWAVILEAVVDWPYEFWSLWFQSRFEMDISKGYIKRLITR